MGALGAAIAPWRRPVLMVDLAVALMLITFIPIPLKVALVAGESRSASDATTRS